jgi:hypothetical protein
LLANQQISHSATPVHETRTIIEQQRATMPLLIGVRVLIERRVDDVIARRWDGSARDFYGISLGSVEDRAALH